MAKIKIGDLVRVKLLNDMYMWVHVLFDSQFIVKGKKEINPYPSLTPIIVESCYYYTFSVLAMDSVSYKFLFF